MCVKKEKLLSIDRISVYFYLSVHILRRIAFCCVCLPKRSLYCKDYEVNYVILVYLTLNSYFCPQASTLGTKIIDEDGLFDLVRTMPGKKSKYELAAETEVGLFSYSFFELQDALIFCSLNSNPICDCQLDLKGKSIETEKLCVLKILFWTDKIYYNLLYSDIVLHV